LLLICPTVVIGCQAPPLLRYFADRRLLSIVSGSLA
jgi:hypothetical protein